MNTVKILAVASALLVVSATSLAKEPDQRAMDLALSLHKAALGAAVTTKTHADASVQAPEAIRASMQAVGLQTEVNQPKESK